jgi:hypothetical protein
VIFGQDRDELRRMYHDAWRRSKAGEVLSPLQAGIAQIIQEHPEYQSLIEGPPTDSAFLPELGQSNPYLHLGLHLAIREQLATDRPAGIRSVFGSLSAACGDAHAAEHAMLECLAESLWEAQRDNSMPDELRYLERLKRLRGRSPAAR